MSIATVVNTESQIVTFLARGKRYGKWKALELAEVEKSATPEEILNQCNEFAKLEFNSDHVEIQSLKIVKK